MTDGSPGGDELHALLAEQLAYYRARAPEYTESTIPELPPGELVQARELALRALDAFHPSGAVLELACGPGTWTGELRRYADTVTAVDGAPEMLEIARGKVRDERVRFVQADLFDWEPDQCYDAVFFGFWLSHVPIERFEAFWSFIRRCLRPEGRVAFVDDGFRTPDELIDGDKSQIVHRRLSDGRAFRAVKVPHRPDELERRLQDMGWRIRVSGLKGPFFWGEGRPAT